MEFGCIIYIYIEIIYITIQLCRDYDKPFFRIPVNQPVYIIEGSKGFEGCSSDGFFVKGISCLETSGNLGEDMGGKIRHDTAAIFSMRIVVPSCADSESTNYSGMWWYFCKKD